MYGAKPHQHRWLYPTGRGGKKKKKKVKTEAAGGRDRYSNTALSAPAAPDVISHHRCRHQEDKWLPRREHGRLSERAMKAVGGTRASPETVAVPTLVMYL